MPVSLRVYRLITILFVVAIFMATKLAYSVDEFEKQSIHILTIDGIINPLSARYLNRKIERTKAVKSQAMILQLNTPGGLETSMRAMTQDILDSPIPIIVFVTPRGGRAASAGMFITMAGHVAAMAPGTNIGAAHPVAVGGGPEQIDREEAEPRMAKAVEDAAALARSIAATRNRNAGWAEEAVRKSVSITADEAVEQNVVDFIANDLDDLIAKIHGKVIALPHREVTLDTFGAPRQEAPMDLAERILQAITDPNIAYLLMTIGFIGIIAELYNPGMLIPGITGVIALLMSFAALGSLPLNWVGLLLLALGIILFVVELYTEGTGLFSTFGIISFVLGSLILYQPFEPVSPAMPEVKVNRWLIAAIVILIAAFFIFVARSVLKTMHYAVATGPEILIGKVGRVTSNLSPSGRVNLEGEDWTATLEGDEDGVLIPVGSHVKVTGVEGITLKVQPVSQLKKGDNSKKRDEHDH